MGKREARLAIEKDYMVVMAIRRLKVRDDAVINNILETIRTWQGFFPGEDEDSVAINREMDKRAVNGFTDGLVKHFRGLGLIDDNKSDYYNLFTLYKQYIKPDPTGVNHPIVKLNKRVNPPGDDPEMEWDKQTANSVSENPQPELADGTFLNKTKKGEKEMATIGDVMNTAQGILGSEAELQDKKTGVSSELAHMAANKVQEDETEERLQWMASHPIKHLIVAHRPLKDRLADPGKVTYPIVNASKRLTKIVEAVWKVQKMSTKDGPVDNHGNVNGALAIPDCVADLGNENIEDYKLVMTTLQKAAADPGYEVEADLEYKFSGWKGAELTKPATEGGDDTVFKWGDLKQVVANNSLYQLHTSLNPSVFVQQRQLSEKQLAKKSKKLQNFEDITTLVAGGTSEAIDLKTGKEKEGLSIYAYEVTDVDSQIPVNNARSVMRFRYKKNVKTQDGKIVERTSSVALYLTVPVKTEKLTNDEEKYKIFKGGTMGQKVTPYTPEERIEKFHETVAAAIAHGVATANMNRAFAEAAAEQHVSDSAAAEDIDAELL